MRPIGKLQDEAQARRFGDFLSAKGVENQVDPDSQNQWEVWILDDVNLATAQSLLEQFRRTPGDPAFAPAPPPDRRPEEAAPTARRARVVDARTIFYTPPVPLGPLTMALIGISIAVTLLATWGGDARFQQAISITEYRELDGHLEWHKSLPEVLGGQVWRLFTPMFLHFDLLHILFNMLWLRDLGSMIEARKGPWMLLLLTFGLAGTSNIGQYLANGPAFGGMSGVVYGLLGYSWMQGRFDPASKLSLQPQTVLFMIVWFFICLSGMVGDIANTAHAVGLAVGVGAGFLDARVNVALRRS